MADVLCCLAQPVQTRLFSVEGAGWQWTGPTLRLHSTPSDSVACDEHNIWNPVLELLFHVHVGAFMEAYFDEADLVIIAHSCHFALDVLCDKAEVHFS